MDAFAIPDLLLPHVRRKLNLCVYSHTDQTLAIPFPRCYCRALTYFLAVEAFPNTFSELAAVPKDLLRQGFWSKVPMRPGVAIGADIAQAIGQDLAELELRGPQLHLRNNAIGG